MQKPHKKELIPSETDILMNDKIVVYIPPVLMTWQHFIVARPNIHHFDTPMENGHFCSKLTTWGFMK